VPKQNLYRRLARLIDWNFLYQQTQALYSHTGQPSLDPVVFFKLMLVSRLENLVSDRRLIEQKIFTAERRLVTYLTLKKLKEALPADQFTWVHKFYLVRNAGIQAMQGNILELAVGVQHRKALLRVLHTHVLRRGEGRQLYN
jgi:hypothetical protein